MSHRLFALVGLCCLIVAGTLLAIGEVELSLLLVVLAVTMFVLSASLPRP